MLRAATITEITKTRRVPAFVIPTIVFPIMFFAMFGLPNANVPAGPVTVGAYLMVSYGGYALMNTALISFGVSLASERALGWNRLLRVTPISATAYVGAKAINAFLIGALALLSLFVFAAVTAHVSLGAGVWFRVGTLLLFGMLPFVFLGIALGYSVGPTAAAPVANLISLPLAFGSGLFMPLSMLPKAVQRAAPYLPSYHLGQLGWTAMGVGDDRGQASHIGWMTAYSVVFGVMAIIAYKRDEGRQFG